MYVDAELQLETLQPGRQRPGVGHQRVGARRPARGRTPDLRPSGRHGRRTGLTGVRTYAVRLLTTPSDVDSARWMVGRGAFRRRGRTGAAPKSTSSQLGPRLTGRSRDGCRRAWCGAAAARRATAPPARRPRCRARPRTWRPAARPGGAAPHRSRPPTRPTTPAGAAGSSARGPAAVSPVDARAWRAGRRGRPGSGRGRSGRRGPAYDRLVPAPGSGRGGATSCPRCASAPAGAPQR